PAGLAHPLGHGTNAGRAHTRLARRSVDAGESPVQASTRELHAAIRGAASAWLRARRSTAERTGAGRVLRFLARRLPRFSGGRARTQPTRRDQPRPSPLATAPPPARRGPGHERRGLARPRTPSLAARCTR